MTGCRVGVRFVVEVARNSGGRICRAQSEVHACHACRIGMDYQTLRRGRDKRVPPGNGPDKRVPPMGISEGHACHARRIGKTPTIGGLFARPIKQSSILWGGFHQTIGFLRQSLAVPLP